MTANMRRPLRNSDAILRHVASWGDRFPHFCELSPESRHCQSSQNQALFPVIRVLDGPRASAYASLLRMVTRARLGQHSCFKVSESVWDPIRAEQAFFALNECDRGTRGYPSGSRYNLSYAGTKTIRTFCRPCRISLIWVIQPSIVCLGSST